MKKFIIISVVLMLAIYTGLVLAAGGNSIDSITTVGDGSYEMAQVLSNSAFLFSDTGISGIDTLDGADSVKIFNNFSPQTHEGWEYILVSNALSGDSAATTVTTLLLDAQCGKNDSIVSHTIVDTFVAAGTSIAIPFGRKKGYIGNTFDMWLKSGGAGSETVIQQLYLYKRRPRQTQTLRN